MDADPARDAAPPETNLAAGCLKLVLVTAASIGGAAIMGYAAMWLMK
jgi:hypothetical protein